MSNVDLTVSQAPERVQLEWFEGDPVDLTFDAANDDGTPLDLSGVYTAEVTTNAGLVVPLTMTATFANNVTSFEITLDVAGSAQIPKGSHSWRAVSGTTKYYGPVVVLGQ